MVLVLKRQNTHLQFPFDSCDSDAKQSQVSDEEPAPADDAMETDDAAGDVDLGGEEDLGAEEDIELEF